MQRFNSFLLIIRRQIFQIRNGGLRGFFLKVHARNSSNDQLRSSNLSKSVYFFSKLLLNLSTHSNKKELVRLNALVPKLISDISVKQNHAIKDAIEFGKELRKSELFSEERKLYEELCKVYPSNIEPLSSLASTKYLDGDIIGWKKDYQSILKISEAESNRRFGADHNLRVLGVEWTGPMGHLAQVDAIIKLNQLGMLSPEKRIIVTNTSQIANSTLLKLWGERIDVFQLSNQEYSRIAEKHWPIFEHVPCIKFVDGNRDQTTAWSTANFLWEKAGNPPLISVSESLETRARKVLRRWGLKDDSWFVGLHVREGEHSLRRQLPNADINTYLPAIRRVIELGGFVIRMGNPLMAPLPKIHGLIDYAHSVERVDWMDVFLWGKSRFFIGTNSGGSDVPQVFGVPVIKSNFSHIGQSFYSPKSFMVPKLFKHKDSGQLLTLSEMFESPFAWTVSLFHEGFKIEAINNDPGDLVDAVNEMELSLRVQDINLGVQDVSELVARSDAIRRRHGALGELPIGNSFLSKYHELIR